MFEDYADKCMDEVMLDTTMHTIPGVVFVVRQLVQNLAGTYQRGVMVFSFKRVPTPADLWDTCLKFVRNPAELEFLVIDSGQSCFLMTSDVFAQETDAIEHGLVWARLKHENNVAQWDEGWESNKDRARRAAENDKKNNVRRSSFLPMVANVRAGKWVQQ